ncbi:MAG: hypothetical protein GY822_13730 [Deltaproteobacteria bacterium]|nr:hypothetical protein [Deltaproteobacteria bacterium]
MVGPGDILEIRVFREKELSGTFEVNGDGEIRLPLLDALVVNNLTSAEITEKVEAAYNEKYLKNAQVTVFVKDYNSRKIIVVGEVKKPGPVAYRVRMTIVEAVARAGGTTRLAAPSKTIIIREKNGERVRFLVDLNEVKRGDSADIVLYPGDIISVPVSPF